MWLDRRRPHPRLSYRQIAGGVLLLRNAGASPETGGGILVLSTRSSLRTTGSSRGTTSSRSPPTHTPHTGSSLGTEVAPQHPAGGDVSLLLPVRSTVFEERARCPETVHRDRRRGGGNHKRSAVAFVGTVSVSGRRGAIWDGCDEEHVGHTGKNRDTSKATRSTSLSGHSIERRGLRVTTDLRRPGHRGHTRP